MFSNGVLFPLLGILSIAIFMFMSFGDLGRYLLEWKPHSLEYEEIMSSTTQAAAEWTTTGFVVRNGTHLLVDGKVFYVNGWNSYWLMDQAVEESNRPRVRKMFQAAARMGLTVCRTWAFNDATYNALQLSPGHFDERVFKALDTVIMEARRHGIRLLLSLTNDLEAYGGKTQYVKWAWDEGIGLSSSNDSFFTDPSIRNYFKDYLKAILTRKNHLSGVQYKDDPTIFAWELINEPRCASDPSGDTLHEWIEDMARYVKSIDKNHLLTVGLEGFYGLKGPKEKLNSNPRKEYDVLGSDFLRNFNISEIDFASVHIYPDNWLAKEDLDEKLQFIHKWVRSHIQDGDEQLKKPVLFTEFGLSDKIKNFDHSQRDLFFKSIFDLVYKSAKAKRSGAGALLWQFFLKGMEEYHDEFGFVPEERPSMYRLIKEQSCRLAKLNYEQEVLNSSYRKFCSDLS